MKAEWERKYRAALTEPNPSLKWRRIEEAWKVTIHRMNEIEDDCDERHKLDKSMRLGED